MKRRRFLALAAVTPPALAFLLAQSRGLAAADEPSLAAIENDWRSLLPDNADVSLTTEPMRMPEAEWRTRLDVKAYEVLFEEGTERPFSSPLNDEKRAGVYVCAACRLPLFTSAMKYDSGTGWPSFFTHIRGHLDTKTDFRLIWPRTEYHCVKCGGHQGHVFDDGPAPTGQRWCNNGVALSFLPVVESG
jgi:peptide-methionine (R)-S-oxide reductase